MFPHQSNADASTWIASKRICAVNMQSRHVFVLLFDVLKVVLHITLLQSCIAISHIYTNKICTIHSYNCLICMSIAFKELLL